jgi:hypothetical protein
MLEPTDLDPELTRLLTWWMKNKQRVAWAYGADQIIVGAEIACNIELTPDEVLAIKDRKAFKLKIPAFKK